MDKPLVSVVTPIYNAERYLKQCLESLKAQTLECIEFICIDDGSNDSSPMILQEYVGSDSRFRVVRQENVGYGCTMNRGMQMAKGEYVGFLDADDFIEPDAFETLYNVAVAHSFPDIVKANYYEYTSKKGDKLRANNLLDACGKVLSVADEQGRSVLRSVPSIWAAIYRLDFLRKSELALTEVPGVAYQDAAFVFKTWIAASSFVLIDKPFVHYRTDNPGSSVKAAGNVFRVCEEFDLIEDYACESDFAEEILPYVIAKRFNTYEWNVERLRGEEREQFVVRASADFAAYRDAGMLQCEYYTEAQWGRLVKLIDHPLEYYAWVTYGRELARMRKRAVAAEQALAERSTADGQDEA